MSNPNRVAGGIPSGGQFAIMSHTEALEVLREAQQAAMRSVRDTSLDRDDIAQEALLQYLKAVRSGAAAGVQNRKAYLNGAVSNLVSTRLAGRKGSRNSADKGAFTEYNDGVAALRDELGRSLTRTEEDALADKIVESRPARRRPTRGFHRPIAVSSLDAGESTVEPVAGSDLPAENFAIGSHAEHAMQALEGAGGKLAARRHAWNALAEKLGAPLVAEGTLTSQARTKANTVVDEGGGPVELADRWLAGDLEPDSAEAQGLFAPYGELDDAERDDLAGIIAVKFRAHGEDLWSAAVTAAVRPR
ncbi:MAG: hypothetical protein M3Y35_05150 [Actinomycetota bacterium]|nr:hypothetical protein [Actinomycetota bacterium]